MESQNRINLMPDHELMSMGDGEIEEEDRHSESRGGKTISMKKRRGRPRKNNAVDRQNPPSTTDSQAKPERRLGRPTGFGKSQVFATLGSYAWETIGGDFTPHVIIVAPTENIVNRISNFSLPWRRAICIISAFGSVSSVIIHKPNYDASTLTFEGMFEILRLSGWFYGGDNKKPMTISFSKSNGQVFGGVVASSLIAATPVQIIVGSFIRKVEQYMELNK